MENSKDKVSLEDFKKVQRLVEFMEDSSRRMEQSCSMLLSFLEKIYGPIND